MNFNSLPDKNKKYTKISPIMQRIILFCCVLFIFQLNNRGTAQLVWEENFGVVEKGYWVDGSGTLVSDFSGVAWSLDVSNARFAAPGDYACTVATSGGRFEVVDSDGEVVWRSPEIDISACPSVTVSFKSTETGSNTGADKKYLKARYLIDGISHPFQPDPVVSGNWGTKTVTLPGIKDGKLRLELVINSSYSADKVIVDDIRVEGVDTALYEPETIGLTLLPPFAFAGEVITITAAVLDKRGEAITNRLFDLSFTGSAFEMVTSGVENGRYYWKVKPVSTGKASFEIRADNSTMAPATGSIRVYSPTNLLLSDDFEAGNLEQWRLNSGWEVSATTPVAGVYSLVHKPQPGGGTSTITADMGNLKLGGAIYCFSFSIKNGNWDPSSSNAFHVALTDQSPLDDRANGYVVGVNATGSSDMVSLWTMKNGVIGDMVAATAFDWNANTMAQLLLTRYPSGDWELSVTDLIDGTTTRATGFSHEVEQLTSAVISFTFTQTRSGQLWFDDFMVLRENTPPAIRNVQSLPDGAIQLCFTEPINTQKLSEASFRLTGAGGQEYNLVSYQIISDDTLVLHPPAIRETNLLISLWSVEDLEGAVVSLADIAFDYHPPLLPLDVVINEVLFNPRGGGSDFVELYNRSGANIDLSALSLATRDDTLGLKTVCRLSKKRIDFRDQSYLVFTKDSLNLVSNYTVPYPDRIVPMSSFPSYRDEGGRVVLLNDALAVIDEFAYSEGMHNGWLSEVEGVSLERLSVDDSTNNAPNWHSASSLAGYATPGYENSQKETVPTDAVEVLLSPDAISPNGDGYHDEMEISFHLDKPGYLANVFVFDVNGRRVNRLLNNSLAGTDGKIVFGGRSENGSLLPMGIYMLLTELVHPDGEKKVFKQAFLVTDKR
jgi:hypothetical protein